MTGTDPNNSGEHNQEKVTFSPEQQEKINELIRDAQGRAAREVRTELETTKSQISALTEELNAAKEAAKVARTPAQKKEAKEDLEALQGQINEMKTAQATREAELNSLRQKLEAKDREVLDAKGEAMRIRKEIAMQRAASKVGFLDVNDVISLTAHSIKFDDTRNKFVVLNDEGVERMNAAFEPLSLEEFYREFAEKKKYMVRSDVKPGANSTDSNSSIRHGKFTPEQIFGSKSDAGLANRVKRENPAEYARLKGAAKEAGLID